MGLCDQTMELEIDLSGAAIVRIHGIQTPQMLLDCGIQTCPGADGPMEHWVTTDCEQELCKNLNQCKRYSGNGRNHDMN